MNKEPIYMNEERQIEISLVEDIERRIRDTIQLAARMLPQIKENDCCHAMETLLSRLEDISGKGLIQLENY